jgi:AcrR family transcriptional regulator
MTAFTAPLLESLRDRASGDPDHERVLNAALDAFMDFGIRRTSMGEIAKRSGLSPATLYRRFAGKDEVVWAVGRREAHRLIAGVDALVDPKDDAEGQIVALWVAFMSALRQNRLLPRLMATEPEVLLPLLTIEAGPVLALGGAYLADFIRRLQREANLPDFDAAPVAEILARLALSMALTPQTCIPVDDEEAARRFARQHIALVFGVAAHSAG